MPSISSTRQLVTVADSPLNSTSRSIAAVFGATFSTGIEDAPRVVP